MTRRHSSTGYSQVLWFGPAMPALATRMSMPPNAAAVAAAAASTCARSETSTACVSTRPRAVELARPSSALSSASRSHSATLAPESRKRSVIARPNPCAAPVTTARRPFRS